MAGGLGGAEDSGGPASASSGGSGASRVGRDQGFHSQMDENGIVGLDWAEEEAGQEVGLETGQEAGGAEEGEGDLESRQGPLEDQSFHLSELQDGQSSVGDGHARSLCDVEVQGSDNPESEDDEGSWLIGKLLGRDRRSDMTKDVEEEEEGTDDPMENTASSFWAAVDPRDRQQQAEAPEHQHAEAGDLSPAGGYQANGGEEEQEVASVQVSRESLGLSNEGVPLITTLPAQPPYPPLPPSPPAGGPQHLLQSSDATSFHPCLASSPGLESDAFAESVLEIQLEPHNSQRNISPRNGISSDSESEESQDSDRTSEGEDVAADETPEVPYCCHLTSPLPQTLKTMCLLPQVPPPSTLQPTHNGWRSPSDPTPGLRAPKVHRTSTGVSPKRGCAYDSSRYGKGQLHYPLPDFSKVEPRVHFPKEGYKPPRSKGCLRKTRPGSEKPLVFKSPADIVREVLSSAKAPPLCPAPSTPAGPQGPQRAVDATVPQEFRSSQQASALVHQLQEDYNRLLTKYAEAENTIDRLRLEAKVNLYSDPPRPSHPDYTGTMNMGSKVITMTLPRAQRAQLDLNVFSPKTDPAEGTGEMGDRSTVALPPAYNSTCCPGPRFGQLLTEPLSRQAEGLQMQVDSFEELLREGKLKPYEEVLKGLSCLSEGQSSLEQGYLRAREKHSLLQQQGRHPEPFDPHRELEGEIFRSGIRLEELKEQLGMQIQPVSTAVALTPPRADLTKDPSTAPCSLSERRTAPTGVGAKVSMGMPVSSDREENEGEDEGESDKRWPSPLSWARCHRYQHEENDLSPLPQQVPEGAREGPLGPAPGCSQQEPLPLCPTSLWQPSQDKKWGGARSRRGSTASAGESAGCEGPPKPGSSLRRAPPQDGIMSPETDSGFVGSQCSHLNLLTPSPAQKEAIASPSPALERGGDAMLPVTPLPRLGSTHQGQTSPDHFRAVTSDHLVQPSTSDHLVQPSTEKRKLPLPSSPRHWPSTSTSEFESENNHPHSSSEDEEEGQSVRYSQSPNQSPRHQRSSLTALHRPGNSFGIQGADRPSDRHCALQALQAEMSRLSEQLKGSLRTGKSSYPITVPPLVQEVPLHSQNGSEQYLRFFQRQADERREEEGEQGREGKIEEEEVEGKEEAPYARSSPVPRLRPELDITTDSQHSQPNSKPESYARHIPASSGVRQWSWRRGEERTEPVGHRRPHTGQQCCMAASEGPDEVSRRRSHSQSNHTPNYIHMSPTGVGTAGGGATARHTCPRSGYCARCRVSRRYRDGTKSGLSMHRTSGSGHQHVQPMGLTQRRDGGVYWATPPPPVLGSVPLVQYVPVAPPALYYSTPAPLVPAAYPQSLHLLLNRGGRRACGNVHSLPADCEPLSDSLTRAIKAARRMRATSQRMARSLSAGIRHQGALSLS